MYHLTEFLMQTGEYGTHTDILHNIVEFLIPTNVKDLRAYVTKLIIENNLFILRLLKITSKYPFSSRETDIAISSQYLSNIMWMVVIIGHAPSKLGNKFALQGSVDILKWLRNNCYIDFCNRKCIQRAASYGNLNALKWMYYDLHIGPLFDSSVADKAAENEYIHILKWLRYSNLNITCSYAATMRACVMQQYEVEKWISDNE